MSREIQNSKPEVRGGAPGSKVWGLALAAVVLGFSPRAQACAVCFGNSDSKMTQGMLAGVLVLLLVVVGVLAGLVALFIHLARRSAAVAALENQSAKSKV